MLSFGLNGFPRSLGSSGSDIRGLPGRAPRRPDSDMRGVGMTFDPHWNEVVLLLRAVSIDGVIGIFDLSQRKNPVSIVGSSSVTNVGAKFEGAAISGAVNSHVDVTIGGGYGVMTGDFTFELVAPLDLSQCLVYSNVSGSYIYNDAWNQFDGVNSLSYGAPGIGVQWLAFSRTAGVLSSFVDGKKIASIKSVAPVDLSTLYFGYYKPNNNLFFTGKYDSIRITKGVGRYSATENLKLNSSFMRPGF